MSAPAELRARLRALPKVELHRHLEGAFRIGTLWEFHRSQGAKLHASEAALRAALEVPPGEAPGFLPFLSRFAAVRFPYGDLDAIRRLGREAVEDAHADGIVHQEIRFSPVFLARRLREVPVSDAPPPDELVEAAAEALITGARATAGKLGVSVAFICCLGRHFSAAVNRPSADLLRRPVGRHFAALDVAGEEACPMAGMDGFFEPWRAAGKGLTLHAGEDPDGPGARNVREAVEVYGADRVGHGVRAAEDSATLELLRECGTVLEVCVTSNVQTTVAAGYEQHQLKALLDAGVKATLNTDDPVLSAIDLTEEYARAHERCGLSLRQLRALAVAAAEAAFLPAPERAALAERVAEAWDEVIEKS